MGSNGTGSRNGGAERGGETCCEPTLCIEPFSFTPVADPTPDCVVWSYAEVDVSGRPIASANHSAGTEAAEAALARRLEGEVRASFEAGREIGLQQGHAAGREAERASLEAAHLSEASHRAAQLDRLDREFAASRARYFERVEQEVVKLALAVAARILRREAQMDPLLLLGAVRVALGQLDATTEVRLRVPAAEADLWREAVALLPARTARPEVLGEAEMRLGDCVLESDLGSVDLGVRAQLSEIERGFFDRAASLGKAPEPVEETA